MEMKGKLRYYLKRKKIKTEILFLSKAVKSQVFNRNIFCLTKASLLVANIEEHNSYITVSFVIYTHTYTYIYIYIYKGHSINKMNFALRVGNRKLCLQLHLFQGNQFG